MKELGSSSVGGMSLQASAGRPGGASPERLARDPLSVQRSLSRRRMVLSIVFALVAWELVARFVVGNSLLLVGPFEVFQAGIELARTGELYRHFWVSTVELFWGVGTGFVLGVIVGVPMGTSRRIREYLDPWMSALYSTPIMALTPVFILWFGLGMLSKVLVIFLLAFFPVVINTVAGLRSAERNWVDVATSFGATRWQIYTKVLIPAAIPFILAGARLAVGRGVIGVFVAELFGAQAGLGLLITMSSETFNTASLFLGVILLAAYGVVLTSLVEALERRVAPWRQPAIE